MKTNGTLHALALRLLLATPVLLPALHAKSQFRFGGNDQVTAANQHTNSEATKYSGFSGTALNTDGNTMYNNMHIPGGISGTKTMEIPGAIHEGPGEKPAGRIVDLRNSLEIGKFSIRFKRSSFIYPRNPNREVGLNSFDKGQLQVYAHLLKQFAVSHHYDTGYAFLANMGVLSNRKRFFVINLRTLAVEESGLVSHGRGAGMSIYDRNYSNDANSKCTSLGKYMVSGSYHGGFGLSYRIVGLDSTNSNAQKRSIVLHSMHCIPDRESIMPACVSEGCPAVSEKFFSSLRKVIDSRKKPMLLWIIDSNLEVPEITEMEEEEFSPAQVMEKKIDAKSTVIKKMKSKKVSPRPAAKRRRK